MNKRKVAILGATGMVGQRFVTLLAGHPWFDVVAVAASPRSRGKSYQDAVTGRWAMETDIPENIQGMTVQGVEEDLELIAARVDAVFCALDLDKESIRSIEEAYASKGVAVMSNNSAHRWTQDVPMIIPEVNPDHTALIDIQRKNRGWDKGFIAVKPNCSIQSYVAVLSALKAFEPAEVTVTSMQAISGAGRTFDTWPEMIDNIIPLIGGEEEKSEREPMKIWGNVSDGKIVPAEAPTISATCVRVPVTQGHMANVTVRFGKKPSKQQILGAIADFKNPILDLNLPSAPAQFIKNFDEEDRPQARLDRDFEKGMGVTMGRLRQDKAGNWQFISLSHNTIRGAAGGAVLMAELLAAKNYF